MPFKNGTKLCICEICDCGRHRCPHRSQTTGPYGECNLSEYTNQYHPHRINPVQSCKPPAQAIRGDGPLSDKTTHRVDYIEHPLEKPFIHQPDAYKPPEGQFDGTTMYNSDYTEKRGDRAHTKKREGGRIQPGRFEGEPTYRNDYRRWEIPKIERGGANYQWAPPKDNFDGIATYTSDYIPHRLQMTQSCKPDLHALQSNAPFDGVTDYRQSYISHPLEMKKQKEKVPWSRPSAPFDGITTFTSDYTPKDGGRTLSCKPLVQALHSNAPLQNETTNRVDYRPWETNRPFHHVPDQYRPPEGDMDMNTTYVNDYPGHTARKQPGMKPKDKPRAVGPFEGTTDYNDNYKRWEMARRPMMGPNNAYNPPNVPFEGQSTFQAHYVPHPLDRNRSFKPENRAAGSDAPFDDGTIYRTEYTPKQIHVCPAALLDRGSSAYIFREQDNSTGHKFYEPVQSTVTDLRTGRTVAGNGRVPLAAAS